jgi:hypothetical protein
LDKVYHRINHSFKTGSGLRLGFRVLTGSLGRPGQFFKKKSKRHRFSKEKQKKNKSQRVTTGSCRVNRVAGSHRVFPSSIFSSTRPGFDPGSAESRVDQHGPDRVSKLRRNKRKLAKTVEGKIACMASCAFVL